MANVREGRSAAALMAALTPVQLVAVHLFVVWIQFSEAPEEVMAKPGENFTLQCNTSTDDAIQLLKWKRPGLEHYIFYFRDNRLYEAYQDPRYRGRVELKDPEMRNGDASVVLKNVSTDDTGRYQCRVITLSNNRRKRDVREFVRSVHLTVSEGPEKESSDKHLKNGDANDEQPGGPRGLVELMLRGDSRHDIIVVIIQSLLSVGGRGHRHRDGRVGSCCQKENVLRISTAELPDPVIELGRFLVQSGVKETMTQMH
ncbi:hypothetical protein F7725_005066 [Dissostichus mawsoni]|uniref:Ig-like domain-containing protein n=1 Tax=Dissostichus mawsoni TaxID=36200 RepID=A0A7J5XKJ3_DISMA|nr:hypothetical protein F7725_005066 [Dissostichus mawsoni]